MTNVAELYDRPEGDLVVTVRTNDLAFYQELYKLDFDGALVHVHIEKALTPDEVQKWISFIFTDIKDAILVAVVIRSICDRTKAQHKKAGDRSEAQIHTGKDDPVIKGLVEPYKSEACVKVSGILVKRRGRKKKK